MRTLRLLANHDMASLEPNGPLSDSSSATQILKTLCPGLVRLDNDLTIKPAVARAWSISSDHRVFRFSLQPNATFHNGRPVNAERVAWNFHRLLDPKTGSVLAADYAGMHVKATASDEVEFTFEDPFPAFLYHLGWRTHLTDDTLDQPVGAGAFRLVEWEREKHVILERHEGYWEPDRPLVDRVVVRFALSMEERAAIFEDGEADVVENVPAQYAVEWAARGLLHSDFQRATSKTFVAFNCAEAPFDDYRVRLAVAHTIDRNSLRERFFGDRARTLTGVYPEDEPWGIALEPYDYDPQRARALMIQAGLSEGVTVRVASAGLGVTPKVVEAIGEMLVGIGIRFNYQAFDDPPWWPFIYLSSPWQLAVQNSSGRPHPDVLFRRDFTSGAAFNPCGYSSPGLDELVAKARITIDEAEQRRLYAEAQRVVHADLPILPLFATDTYIGWRPGVTGVSPHPMGFINMAEIAIV